MSSYTQLLTHFVFSTKDRTPSITSDLRDDLYAYIVGILHGQNASCIEIGGICDHLHILARLHQDSAPSELMRVVKSNSSKWANERPNRRERFEWQTGFGAFTVSTSAKDAVAQYIREQEQHHAKLTFQEEFVLFLKRHGIDYNPQFLWA